MVECCGVESVWFRRKSDITCKINNWRYEAVNDGEAVASWITLFHDSAFSCNRKYPIEANGRHKSEVCRPWTSTAKKAGGMPESPA